MLLRNRAVIQLIIAAINPAGLGWLLCMGVTAPCAPLAWNNKAITAKLSNKTFHHFTACPKLTGCSFAVLHLQFACDDRICLFVYGKKKKKVRLTTFCISFSWSCLFWYLLFPLFWFHYFYYHHHHYFCMKNLYLVYVKILALIKTCIFKTN